MNSISINRFWRTLRWVLCVNRHTLILWTAGSAVGVFLFEVIMMWINGNDGSMRDLNGMSQLMTLAIYIAYIIGFCSIASGIDNKANRASMLMLPASNAEKFLSLLVYVSVVLPLCIFLAYMAGDVLRMGVRAMMGLSGGSTILLVLDNMSPIARHGLWQETVFVISFFVLLHSWFVLVGTTFRRYAFVVANLVIVLVFMIGGYIVTQLMAHNGIHHINLFSQSWENGVMVVHHVSPISYFLIVLHIVLTMQNYWRSYRVFKQMQLISNKWTNYITPNNWKRYDFFIR